MRPVALLGALSVTKQMKPFVDLGWRRTGGPGGEILKIDECVRSALLPILLYEGLENFPYTDHRAIPRSDNERLTDDVMCYQVGKVIVEASYFP
jgi:hypothetical protein